MRVISGTARNRKLIAPEGLHTRPVTDQIKESLFNIWQFSISGCHFLDLFSGSGSMGIEAMSRGADYTVMVDNSYEAFKVIKTNIKNCKLEDCNHKVYKEDVFKVIKLLAAGEETFDIIYADPPFTVDSIFWPVMEALSDGKLLKEGGVVAIRTLTEKEMPERFGVLKKEKERKYGISMVHFYFVNQQDSE